MNTSHPVSDIVRAGRSVTLIGAVVNTFLVILKFVTGIFGHSHALVADAVHSISDLFTDAIVLVSFGIARKPPDDRHHFGHARIETLSSAIMGLVLAGTAVYLGVKSGLNIYHKTAYHPNALAFAGAVVSIILKESLYHYTVSIGRRIKSPLLVANAWHHRSDAFSSVAVLVGIAGVSIRPAWHILDAYAALIVSLLILKVSFDILAQTVREFTDTAPHATVLNKIIQCSLDVAGVLDTHDLRVRTFGGLYQVEIHIVVDGTLSVSEGHGIAKAVEHCLVREIGDLDRVIVHVDPDPPEKK